MKALAFAAKALLVWLVTGLSCSLAVEVVIVAGQSNASGRASSRGLTSELDKQPDVLYWYDTDRGKSRDTFRELRPLSRSFGPELNLGKVLAGSLQDEVAIVKVAVGGTTLAQLSGSADWSPNSSDELYADLIQNVTSATAALLEDGKTPHLAGLFWMQGESDAKSGNLAGGQAIPPQPETANAYEANLREFITRVRLDLDQPDMPVFVGQINIGDNPNITTVPDSNFNTSFGEWDFTPAVQLAQETVASSAPNTYLVETDTFELGNDFLHFNQAGQLALGEAFAAAYLATVPEPSSGSLIAAALGLCILIRYRSPIGQHF